MPCPTTDADGMPVKPTHIGGQALMEGIMMRGRYNWAVAVREPSGTIYTEEHDLVSAKDRYAWLRLPVIRGVWSFGETLVLALKAFSISAEHSAPTGEGEAQPLSSKDVGISMILGVVLAVVLFIVAPALITNLIVGDSLARPFVWNVVDGVLRLLVFVGYIWAISRMREIQRVFAYHGAEHKTIHAYERGLPFDTDVIQRFPTLHVRCGTAFLLMVMVVAVFVFSLVPGKAILASWGVSGGLWVLIFNIGIRIVLLPLIAGLAYEITVKWAGSRPDHPFVKVLLWPGLQMQRLTTAEPDDSMIEIAVTAMNLVLAREAAEAQRVVRYEQPSGGSL